MNYNLLRISVFLLFSLFFKNIFAQQDTLILYTKSTCSNCKAVKGVLESHNIGFTEKDLADNDNAIEMLGKLKVLHFDQQISLPVMFLNNNLIFPAYHTVNGLEKKEIADVMNNLLDSVKQNKLHFTAYQNSIKNQHSLKPDTEELSDCEVSEKNPIYLVVKNYTSESDAKLMMNKLIKDGYIYAGIVYSKGVYRVYSKIFLDEEIAKTQLKNERKMIKDCYLLKTE